MSLTIELSPDAELRLKQLAAEQGRSAEEYAREVLEDTLSPTHGPAPNGAAPVKPQDPHAALRELARQQGVKPVLNVEELLGLGLDESDEFDVDEFLEDRRRRGEADLRAMEERFRRLDEPPR